MPQHISFVLLAEFDIEVGAVLSRQFPTPLGSDELCMLLAGLMLPDGAEKQSEDWTIFFLNQTPLNTVSPLFEDEHTHRFRSDETSTSDNHNQDKLLYVLNLVRTKHDSSVRRGGIVKAMAICTPLPFIQIFKPVLLMALDDYFLDPTIECLERLYDAINAMDLSLMPQLSRSEKMVMRVSERKDVFLEKFAAFRSHNAGSFRNGNQSRTSLESESATGTGTGTGTRPRTLSTTSSASSASHSQSGMIRINIRRHDGTDGHSHRPKTSDESGHGHGRRYTEAASSEESTSRMFPSPSLKDTRYFETCIKYKTLPLPVRVPLYIFEQEVGEYSMIQLIQTFSSPTSTVSGPPHPHLHTSGPLTHPIIILFNAITTSKRVLFLGHGKPAGLISNYVLAACALASGCGSLDRGIGGRCFPYANLTSKEVVESVPGFIAGVTNPIFETARTWDVLCNVDTGKITININRDAQWSQVPMAFPTPPNTLPRPGVSEVSLNGDEESGSIRTTTTTTSQNQNQNQNQHVVNGQRNESVSVSVSVSKVDNVDNAFMEEILSCIALHYGENVIRARFIEYASRFIRLASRYEEQLTGTTSIGYKTRPFADGLGSGLNFWDEGAGVRELQLNANRIEGWRRTPSYELFQEDFKTQLEHNAIQGFDVLHQVWKIRHSRRLSDKELEMIMRVFAEHVQTYEQVVEFLALFPPHAGGLLPLALGLFHQQERIRDTVVEILDVLRAYPVGYQFLQALNPFYRYAYVRLAHDRQVVFSKSSLKTPPAPWASRTPSTRSESSLVSG